MESTESPKPLEKSRGFSFLQASGGIGRRGSLKSCAIFRVRVPGSPPFADEFVLMNSVGWSVSKFVKLLSCGDVVEMGDTLVLETSAFARESSNLSIPTKR